MNSINKSMPTHSFQNIVRGIIFSFLCMGVLTVIVSILLLLTGLKEQSLTIWIYLIHGISLIIGGIITGKGSARKGWYYGGIMGVIYIVIIMLIGFLGFNARLDLVTLSLFVLSFSAAALGGMIGVNLKQ